MVRQEFGKAVVLYTFSGEGDNAENYHRKVDDLKRLLPKEIVELEDQSSLLIPAGSNITELEKSLTEKYNGNLEEHESIVLISICKGYLKCISIQASPSDEYIEKLLNDFMQETDIDRLVQKTQRILEVLKNNTPK